MQAQLTSFVSSRFNRFHRFHRASLNPYCCHTSQFSSLPGTFASPQIRPCTYHSAYHQVMSRDNLPSSLIMEIKSPSKPGNNDKDNAPTGEANRDVNANYRFTITNRMSNPQNYVIFAKAPEITPKPDIVKTNVVVALRGVSSDAYFSMPNDPMFALCGTSNNELREHGITIEVEDAMKVTLGKKLLDGGLNPGTTCDVKIQDQALVFAPSSTSPDSGPLGAFCIKTSEEFTYNEARSRNYILGLSLRGTLLHEIGPLALFMPKPNTRYNITPTQTFYVASSDELARDPVDQNMSQRACEVDFAKLQTTEVHIVHSERGVLTAQVKARL